MASTIKPTLRSKCRDIRFINEFKEIDKDNKYNIVKLENFMCSAKIKIHDEYYKLNIKLTQDYPFAPPIIIFETPINHSNVHDGHMCKGLLLTEWSCARTINNFLPIIVELLETNKSVCAKH